ncbi:MAG: ATP-dependent helicase [Dorea sp.]|jgi:DNA helicase-2/ATP-dependent DNA helicase PcrA|nr:ATP-dependent helicase [Dorea sp.]
MCLNEAQKAAAAHFEGPCLVLAGPGSGKTLTIAKRIEYLIKVYKVRPEEILVITFTKYAAQEMKKRFYTIMGSEDFPVNFGTFHSVYYWILKWAYGLDHTSLLSDGEKYALLRQIIREQEEDPIQEQEEDYLRGLAEEISNVKNNCKDIGRYSSLHYDKELFKNIYTAYEEKKKRLKKIDFEDMLVMCCRLFEERKDILKKWQQKFRYILIDEFQDINQVQYDVIHMLADTSRNLFVVGDDDQSVYGFRGAKPKIMMEFKKDYPETKQLLLDVNYRSDAYIVEGALQVISNNKERYEKKIRSFRAGENGIKVCELKDPVEESLYVLKWIEKLLAEGTAMEEIAVLFRTAADSQVLSEALTQHEIPFFIRERMNNIYEHFTARDMISYFRLSQGIGEKRDFLRIVNRPNRYIGRDSMSEGRVSYESLRNFYCDKRWMLDRIDRFQQDIQMMSGRSPYAAIQYIRKSIGYDDFLREYAQFQSLDHQKLKETLDQIQESSKAYVSVEEWLFHVEEYGKMLSKKQEFQRNCQKEKGIALHTMHGAKGLEFDTVFIIGANEGTMPYRKAKLQEEVEEERRLFYVAMTRAKKRLVITCTKEKYGKNLPSSRFLYELTGSQN